MGEKCNGRTAMSFIRLNITAEGQTEERFVKDTLAKHLGRFNISTDVRRVLTSKDRFKSYRGGLLSYQKTKRDIETWLKEDNNAEVRFSTMFDLYALPDDFPKFEEAKVINDIYEKVNFLEVAMQEDIGDYRFIPYIQLHEFEALVLANPQNLAYEYLEHESAIENLQTILDQFGGNAELINTGRTTAPSKRILQEIPEYSKVAVGASIAGIDGIEPLKEKCRHFREWLTRLEQLSA